MLLYPPGGHIFLILAQLLWLNCLVALLQVSVKAAAAI
jgi:hypothetical protein